MNTNRFDQHRTILASVGFTPALIELNAYEQEKLIVKARETKYAQVKTSLGIAKKKQLEVLAYSLILENIELARIIKTHVENTVNNSEL